MKRRFIDLAIMALLLFVLAAFCGCASSMKKNRWLPQSSFNSINDAEKLGLNSLNDIKKKVKEIEKERASPARLKKLLGNNLSRQDSLQTRNILFPHQGITITQIPKWMRACVRSGTDYYSYVFDATKYTANQVGGFIKNKLRFKKIKIRDGFKYRVIFFYTKDDKYLGHIWSETPIFEKQIEKDALGPLGGIGAGGFVRKVLP